MVAVGQRLERQLRLLTQPHPPRYQLTMRHGQLQIIWLGFPVAIPGLTACRIWPMMSSLMQQELMILQLISRLSTGGFLIRLAQLLGLSIHFR